MLKLERKRAKEPHYITSNLLQILGGEQVEYDVAGEPVFLIDGAYLWGAKNREKGAGILNHVLKSSRVAYYLAKALKEAKIPSYKNINLEYVVHAAILHDINKLYGESREKLSAELKQALGIPPDFRETSAEAEQVISVWLKEFGFASKIINAITEHDFPQQIKADPYWKIIVLADYMASQEVMTITKRLKDVRTRWIDKRVNQGLEPRIDPKKFARAQANIEAVSSEIFGALNTTDQEFINEHQLDSDESETRWEKFLLRMSALGREGSAKRWVPFFIG